jgi:hypothetical protein
MMFLDLWCYDRGQGLVVIDDEEVRAYMRAGTRVGAGCERGGCTCWTAVRPAPLQNGAGAVAE